MNKKGFIGFLENKKKCDLSPKKNGNHDKIYKKTGSVSAALPAPLDFRILYREAIGNIFYGWARNAINQPRPLFLFLFSFL
jgi:hypothetical protein